MLPPLLDVLATEAPNIRVQLLTARRRASDDLRAENLDLIIAPRQLMGTTLFEAGNRGGELVHESLFVDRFVCVAGARNRAPRRMTKEEYLRRPHASFFLDLDTHASLEHAYLQRNQIDQFDRILIASFSLLPMIAASSDCLTLIPESLARLMAPLYRLRLIECPLPVPDLDLVSIWHRRRNADPGLAWLRATLRRCAPSGL